jgi:Fic family protein/DNA-binding XRE family transcriptional regulator
VTDFSDLRNRLGFTQLDLAEAAHLSPESISRIEKGRSPHKSTIERLAKALKVSDSLVLSAVAESKKKTASKGTSASWTFLKGLDPDLQRGCLETLVVNWTHGSTGLEGNTLTAGDTHLILKQGLTISGKSLLEHQEVYGHGDAIRLLEMWSKSASEISIQKIHELHRAIQTGVAVDIFCPVGNFKVETNGTSIIHADGSTQWHEYTSPIHVPILMASWQKDLKSVLAWAKKNKLKTKELVNAYTRVHLGFTSIHPYADGNGRMARLVANLPILEGGMPPLTINPIMRKQYMILMGEYTIARGRVTPDEELILNGTEFNALRDFFLEQWNDALKVVDEFHTRQQSRTEI